jgi:predicted molibdopterin-dependent oxidoreductase YjgC
VNITVNGEAVEAREGETVLNAARRAGVEIPTLCEDARLDPVGCCRMCLVEVDGQRRLQPACTWKASDGLAVTTESERIARHRKTLLEMYLADHAAPEAGPLTPRNELLELSERYGAERRFAPCESPREAREDANPYIDFDPALCIACARCVRYCDEVEAVSAITLAGRGAGTTIATAGQIGLLDSTCELCGGCIDTCPTGAMREKKPLSMSVAPDAVVETTRTTCNFCGVGCQLDLHVAEGRVVKVGSPPPGETLNDGNLCVKGRFAYDFIHHEERLKTPLVRGADGKLHEATWAEALEAAAKGLLGVKERHGADALGFISSSRCTGEENYLVQKLARAAFGTNNCHQCAAT